MIKRVLCLGLTMVFCAGFAACGIPESAGTRPEESVSDDFVAEISETFSFSDVAAVNPFMGYAPRSDSDTAPDDCSLYYVDVTFRELEPEEGVFDFETIEAENKLEQRRREGKHIVFRFVCDDPGKKDHLDIPDWLYEKIGGDGTHYDNDYGRGFSPNYSNQIFIDAHADAIAALGEHFGRDTFFSYIELGSLGHWGEWHVDYASGIARLPDAAVREQYIEPYLTAFPNAKILMRRPFATAKTYGFGLYNDVTGDPEGTESWLDWIENGGTFTQTGEADGLAAMADAWKTAPVGGELTGSYTMRELMIDNLEQTLSLISKSHMTFIGPKTPLSTDERYASADDTDYYDGADAVLRSVGYRIGIAKLEISAVGEDGFAEIRLTWENDGAAPLYFEMPVYLYVLSPDGTQLFQTQVDIDLTQLAPGESAETATALNLSSKTAGTTIGIGAADPMTQQPCMRLVNGFAYANGKNYIFSYK